MSFFHLFAFISMVSICHGRNFSDVFVPYIAASLYHREAKALSGASASVPNPRLTPNPKAGGLSEEQARHLVLARPGASVSRKGSKKKSYAQGHTYIPTVNLKTPSHPVGQPAQKSTANDLHPASDASPKEDASAASEPDLQIKSATYVNNDSGLHGHAHHQGPKDIMNTQPAEGKHPKHDNDKSTASDTSILADHESTGTVFDAKSAINIFRGSRILPLSIAAALLWLIVAVIRRSGCLGLVSRRKTAMLRKMLTSPKDMRV